MDSGDINEGVLESCSVERGGEARNGASEVILVACQKPQRKLRVLASCRTHKLGEFVDLVFADRSLQCAERAERAEVRRSSRGSRTRQSDEAFGADELEDTTEAALVLD